MIVRIVDIGSNSIKASLFAVEEGRHRQIDKEKLDLALGDAVFAGGAIPEAATDRVAAFVAQGGRDARSGGTRPHFTFVLATSAVRSAKNRDAFARRVSERSGAEVRVLGGAEESYLIHLGIASQAGAGAEETVKTIDIGGGSAEVSWSRGDAYLFGRSYELGAIRLARRFLDDGPLTREAFARVREHAAREFARRAPARVPEAGRAIGSSGNVRAIARMVEAVRGPAFLKAVPEITPGTLEDVAEAALGRAPQGIAAFFGLNSLDRARIVLPAVAVLLEGMRRFAIPRLEITEAGLREGAVAFWSRHGHFNLPVRDDARDEGRHGEAEKSR